MLVVVGGPPESPHLLDRRRIELVGEDLPAQAYHSAAPLGVAEAQALIERWAHAALDSARRGVGDALAAAGCPLAGAGIVATVRDVPPLATVLRSHPLLHVAEGQLAREALAEAAGDAGLAVHYLPPKGPHEQGHTDSAAAMARVAGPPWRKEHKLAAVAALAVLSAARDRLETRNPSVCAFRRSATLVASVVHFGMPTSRPRHQITETPAVAHALDVAARQWPSEPRSKLLLRLIHAGSRTLAETQKETIRARRAAIAASSGKYADAFGDDYLAELRRDWPE